MQKTNDLQHELIPLLNQISEIFMRAVGFGEFKLVLPKQIFQCVARVFDDKVYKIMFYVAGGTIEVIREEEIEKDFTTNDKRIEQILMAALSKWGVRSQVDMFIEEASELTRELLHHRRGRESYICSEIADVHIVLEQLKLVYGYAEVEKHIAEKIKRLSERVYSK